MSEPVNDPAVINEIQAFARVRFEELQAECEEAVSQFPLELADLIREEIYFAHELIISNELQSLESQEYF